MLDAPVERPDDFDLDETWQRIVSHVEQQRLALRVRVLVQPDMLAPVRYVFAKRYEVLGETPDGRIDMELRDVSVDGLAAQLAGFGVAVELVDPPAEVVDALTRIARELAETWL